MIFFHTQVIINCQIRIRDENSDHTKTVLICSDPDPDQQHWQIYLFRKLVDAVPGITPRVSQKLAPRCNYITDISVRYKSLGDSEDFRLLMTMHQEPEIRLLV